MIGSHTVRGTVVAEQLDIIEGAGYRPDRFIWVHTQRDPDFETHLEIAQRGAWIEYDALGSRQFPDFVFVDRIRALIDAELEDRLLLSHDGVWYDPLEPGGGAPRPYIHLTKQFIPSLRAAGINEETIEQLTHLNPFIAFAR